MGDTHVLQGEGWPSSVGVCRVLVFWRCWRGAVYPIFIPLGFPWKGDTTSTFVSPRHQMWGRALSTFRQFLQPQLPRAVPL